MTLKTTVTEIRSLTERSSTVPSSVTGFVHSLKKDEGTERVVVKTQHFFHFLYQDHCQGVTLDSLVVQNRVDTITEDPIITHPV